MEKCKHCAQEFENRGYLMAHWREGCPAKQKADAQVEPVEFEKEEYEEDCQEEATEFPPLTCHISGMPFVLVNPDEYARLTTNDQLCVEQANIISDLQRQLAEAKQVTAEADGTIYWPLSRLPKEVSLLGDGQYLSLKVSGRIRGNRVEIEQTELAR